MDPDPVRVIGRNREGFVIVYLALALLAMIGFLGLTIDLGHLYLVRGELQNAADASALAGAALLYADPLTPHGVTLDLGRARAAATGFVTQNSSDGTALADGAITAGCWNRITEQKEPCATLPPEEPQTAAVFAVIARSAGNNGGAVRNYFATAVGVAESPVSSREAAAMVAFIGSVPGGVLFPMALPSCMTDHYFSRTPLPAPPITITIPSRYAAGGSGCYTGQWSSFQNDLPDIAPLLSGGNPDSLKRDDLVWIQPLVTPSPYPNVVVNRDVLMAIVDSASGDSSSHGQMAIKGFATYHIDSVNQAGHSIAGYFIDYYATYPGAGPGGALSNSITPPRMVQ